MNRNILENVYSTIFTPQEYQVELIESCMKQNTVAVLASKTTRAFLITMITKELSYQTRSNENGGSDLHTLIIGKSGTKLMAAAEAIQQNTNLNVVTYTALDQVEGWVSTKWKQIVLSSQVIVMTEDVLIAGLELGSIPFELLNLLVITDCHEILSSKDFLCKVLSSIGRDCKILGMTSPVINKVSSPAQLESLLNYLKKITCCNVNTSSEIVSTLRYLHKPEERMIVCGSSLLYPRPDVESEVRRLTLRTMTFLQDHRYDPVEIYGPEYAEFCVGVPDPIKEPKQILTDFLFVLDSLGIWCADRAALYYLVEIEKMKKKTAYDRHYLLLCIVFSLMAQIRAIIEEEFDDHSEMDQILHYSTPKILRLIDILKQVRPKNFVNPRKKKELPDEGPLLVSSKLTPDQCCTCPQVNKINFCEGSISTNSYYDTKTEHLNGHCPDDTCSESSSKGIEVNSKHSDGDLSDSDIQQTQSCSKLLSNLDIINEKTEESKKILNNILGDNEFCVSNILEKEEAINNLNLSLNSRISNNVNNDLEAINEECINSEVIIEECNNSEVVNEECNNSKVVNEECNNSKVINEECNNSEVINEECNNIEIINECNNSEAINEECNNSDAGAQVPIEDIGMETSSSGSSLSNTEMISCNSYLSKASTCACQCHSKGEMPEKEEDIKKIELTATNALTMPSHPQGRNRKRREDVKEKIKVYNPDDPDSVCALLFVRDRNIAKIVYRLLKELSDIGGNFGWIFAQYTVELCKKVYDDPRAAEMEHKKQEEVLRRFRHHECNVLVTTSVLESGIDIPHCNLVIRFDFPTSFTSYVHSRGRAKGQHTYLFHMVTEEEAGQALQDFASFTVYQTILLSECEDVERSITEFTNDDIDSFEEAYVTPANIEVSLSKSIALLNKYCAKLPSDTFTRLTAMWKIEEKAENEESVYQCIIMLPINSPLKGFINGSWMKSRSLAKMSGALKCCSRLHEIGELDDYLLPVGKESMQLEEHLCPPLADDTVPEGMPRPGTTKRRQYYYKKSADSLEGSEPVVDVVIYVYKLEMVLSCPIPDEQNTRGRKIYYPESSSRSFGLITTKPIPEISGFPVFTRSGEVMVQLLNVLTGEKITKVQLENLESFHKFTFTHVLRLEKYPILFNPNSSKSSFFVVPLLADEGKEDEIDWDFVELISSNRGPMPPSEEQRKKFLFEKHRYIDAVVMPWYRNQDQPQYFYVAEICSHLNSQSDFPDAGFDTFEKYYLTKYGIQICNLKQPLLDVDHTSGRLNLLTPRHVNRKGVALPTTSDETKKAKRENLQQKQILVPELCTIHPFPASLWRKAVCLPTILYRLNGLLLADHLRVKVSLQIGLGLTNLPSDFKWPTLDFGWTLKDVLSRSLEAKKNLQENATQQEEVKEECKKETVMKKKKEKSEKLETIEEMEKRREYELEIGTWSNDMAISTDNMVEEENELDFEIDSFDPNIDLPDNLTMLDCCFTDTQEGELGVDWGTGLPERKARRKKIPGGAATGKEAMRVGSPSNFEEDGWDVIGSTSHNQMYNSDYEDDDDDDDDDDFYDYSSDQEDNVYGDKPTAIEWEGQKETETLSDVDSDTEWPKEAVDFTEEDEKRFKETIEESKKIILESPIYVAADKPIVIKKYIPDKVPLLVKKSSCAGSNSVQNDPQHVFIVTENAQIVPVDRKTTLKELDTAAQNMPPHETDVSEKLFSFDHQPELLDHPGPSPSIILQALTMSNANDGLNLERLETIGDSYLKYSITNYLYCTYTQKHEGKLSYLRSKQVSNLNLYRLGKCKQLGECMVATKFEPHDNWLPPGYFVPKELEQALIDSGVPAGHWNMADFPGLHDLKSDEIRRMVEERSEQMKQNDADQLTSDLISVSNPKDLPIFIPYNLLTQHSIPDKSIADCVEALIGAYLTTCGPRGALLFMSWLGIKVLPSSIIKDHIVYHQIKSPRSPLSYCPLPDAEQQLNLLLSGYDQFEIKINYKFRDKSYLIQSFTHASYHRNRLTDCYQRLEFLGDAVLDYLITRHLFEDKRMHTPGALTDLRSALVNNTIFASLAVKFEFHKYFRHFSPGLDRVIRDFVRMQEENGHKINEEYYFMEEDECETAEDIEVPKALGDVFESVAGAIFLDSGGSLDAVWRVYYFMMKNEIEQFSGVVPKSPIRELLEMEPETAKFGKPERLVDGKVRVSVEIFGKGSYSGVGRNYRIAKSTAAKRALRSLKKLTI